MKNSLNQFISVTTDWIRKIFRNKLFIVTTFIPTSIAVIYFGLWASDVYVSESHFVVRTPDKQMTSPLGSIFKDAGISKSDDDSFSVQDFILSRDALMELDKKLSIREKYSTGNIDTFSRLWGLDNRHSNEDFFKYYKKMVNVKQDSTSSIMTLTASAFTAKDAYEINATLLSMAEDLVNKLNERARQDMIGYALEEVRDAKKASDDATLALASYRNQNNVIDPEKQSSIPLQQIAKMQDDLISTRTQVLQIEALAKDNPQLPALRLREKALEGEIDAQTQRVAGGDRSLAEKAVKFQRLQLNKEFTDKMLASSLAALDQARNEARRKQLYIEYIVQPNLPDKATEPKRLRIIGGVLLLGLIVWGTLSILLAGVREHHDR
jgi:capsular polysaccharide transport system permease protein